MLAGLLDTVGRNRPLVVCRIGQKKGRSRVRPVARAARAWRTEGTVNEQREELSTNGEKKNN